jgi:hypothetical protein
MRIRYENSTSRQLSRPVSSFNDADDVTVNDDGVSAAF